MSSITILFLLIFLLMSVGNLVGVISVFGYDADYWEVKNILYLDDIQAYLSFVGCFLYLVFKHITLDCCGLPLLFV